MDFQYFIKYLMAIYQVKEYLEIILWLLYMGFETIILDRGFYTSNNIKSILKRISR